MLCSSTPALSPVPEDEGRQSEPQSIFDVDVPEFLLNLVPGAYPEHWHEELYHVTHYVIIHASMETRKSGDPSGSTEKHDSVRLYWDNQPDKFGCSTKKLRNAIKDLNTSIMRKINAATDSTDRIAVTQARIGAEMKELENWLPVANPKYNRTQGGFFLPRRTAKNDYDGARKWYWELSGIRGAMERQWYIVRDNVRKERRRLAEAERAQKVAAEAREEGLKGVQQQFKADAPRHRQIVSRRT
ncbi:hypothetical protein Slin15195_G117520 [Septoria linicola]|uniref:Uncharacterized protein n=1 Tax=Septoria linicola TaxID=215465 RepID=A0A9Q9B3T8_9PEZI|nr:hypothetical protein Slin15195_G117520 [Septoria linicola]